MPCLCGSPASEGRQQQHPAQGFGPCLTQTSSDCLCMLRSGISTQRILPGCQGRGQGQTALLQGQEHARGSAALGYMGRQEERQRTPLPPPHTKLGRQRQGQHRLRARALVAVLGTNPSSQDDLLATSPPLSVPDRTLSSQQRWLQLHTQGRAVPGKDLPLSETAIPSHQNPENQRPPDAHIYIYYSLPAPLGREPLSPRAPQPLAWPQAQQSLFCPPKPVAGCNPHCLRHWPAPLGWGAG